jgi:hypothetical protein
MDSSDCPSTSSTAFGIRGYWRFETPSVPFAAFSATFASSAVTPRHPELSEGEDRAEDVFCKIRVHSCRFVVALFSPEFERANRRR